MRRGAVFPTVVATVRQCTDPPIAAKSCFLRAFSRVAYGQAYYRGRVGVAGKRRGRSLDCDVVVAFRRFFIASRRWANRLRHATY